MNDSLKRISHIFVYVIVVILLAGAIAHGPSLLGGFRNLDDDVSIVKNVLIKDVSNAGKILTTSFFLTNSYYRPMVLFSYMLEYYLYGLRPFFFHLNNIFLHILSALVIYLIIRSILAKKNIAFFVSLLFIVHPIHCEAVMNIAGRAILLCGLFYLSAFYCYIKYAHNGKGIGYFLASIALFSAALMSKETAITFPLVIMSFEVVYSKKLNSSRNPGFYLLRVAPYFSILIMYFFVRQVIGITNIVYWETLREIGLGVATFLRAIATYLRAMLLPYDLHFDRTREYFSSFYNVELTLTIFAFFVFLVFLLLVRRKLKEEQKFFILWFFITLVPVCQIVPIRAHLNAAATMEHFLYLPSVGLFALVVVSISSFFDMEDFDLLLKKTTMRTMCAVMLFGYFVTAFMYNTYSYDEVKMLSRALRYEPKNTRMRTFYGLALAKSGMFEQAEQQFRRVIRKEPWQIKARIGLGKSLVDQEKYEEGIAEYEGIRNPGEYAELIQENLKATYVLVIKDYKKKLIFDVQNPDLYFKLGVVYSKMGEIEEAIEEFKKAITLKPDFKSALYNLGAGYEILGDKGQAIIYFERLVKIQGPKDVKDKLANKRLFDLYLGLKDFIRADEYLKAAEAMKEVRSQVETEKQ